MSPHVLSLILVCCVVQTAQLPQQRLHRLPHTQGSGNSEGSQNSKPPQETTAAVREEDWVPVEGSLNNDSNRALPLTSKLFSPSPSQASSSNGIEQALAGSSTEEESELLRETFQVWNPTMLPGYFDDNGDAADAINDTPPKQQPPLLALSNPTERSDAPVEDTLEDESSGVLSLSKRRADYALAVKQSDDNNNDDDDDARFSVEQRSGRCSMPNVLRMSNEDLPWTCRQRWVWRHLGEHVYPSRIYEARCQGTSCWYGHFNCTPITYTLHVLQACRSRCYDQRVPFPLRSRWQWTDVDVTVGCQCIR